MVAAVLQGKPKATKGGRVKPGPRKAAAKGSRPSDPGTDVGSRIEAIDTLQNSASAGQGTAASKGAGAGKAKQVLSSSAGQGAGLADECTDSGAEGEAQSSAADADSDMGPASTTSKSKAKRIRPAMSKAGIAARFLASMRLGSSSSGSGAVTSRDGLVPRSASSKDGRLPRRAAQEQEKDDVDEEGSEGGEEGNSKFSSKHNSSKGSRGRGKAAAANGAQREAALSDASTPHAGIPSAHMGSSIRRAGSSTAAQDLGSNPASIKPRPRRHGQVQSPQAFVGAGASGQALSDSEEELCSGSEGGDGVVDGRNASVVSMFAPGGMSSDDEEGPARGGGETSRTGQVRVDVMSRPQGACASSVEFKYSGQLVVAQRSMQYA